MCTILNSNIHVGENSIFMKGKELKAENDTFHAAVTVLCCHASYFPKEIQACLIVERHHYLEEKHESLISVLLLDQGCLLNLAVSKKQCS